MYLIGIGIDLIEIAKIEKVYNIYNYIFVNKILGSDEKDIFSNIMNLSKKIDYLAKRFAAKEAIAKALGCGIGIMSLKNIQILNNNLGQPQVYLKNPIDYQIKVSLSDTVNNALAVAIIYKL